MANLVLEILERIVQLEWRSSRKQMQGTISDVRFNEENKVWEVRAKIGGTDEKPKKSAWTQWPQVAFGKKGLNIHFVPKEGTPVVMSSPDGVPEQASAHPGFWSDDHPAPSRDKDEVVLTYNEEDKDKAVRATIKSDLTQVKVGKKAKIDITKDKITGTLGAYGDDSHFGPQASGETGGSPASGGADKISTVTIEEGTITSKIGPNSVITQKKDQIEYKLGSSVITQKEDSIEVKVGGSTFTVEAGEIHLKSDSFSSDATTFLGGRKKGIPVEVVSDAPAKRTFAL